VIVYFETADLAAACDVTTATIRRWREEGRVPEPVLIPQLGSGPPAPAWRGEDVERWIGRVTDGR
jgi:hypothetical protein